MSHHIPEAVSWCLVAALVAVAVLLVRQRGITAAVRRRVAALEDGLQTRDTEVRHLVTVRLPAVTASMHQPVPLPGLLDERLGGTVFAQGLQSVMDLFTQAVDKAQARADQSAKAALKASMRALQGLAHEQQLAISDMQERHDNPDVLRDLLQIDHANSQFGRRAQAIAVLCGSWPGRQRAASPLTDVVRGATSRIRDYRRVKVHNHADLAVVSRAVEPVVLAVAELLDNAARHSQPNTSVEVGLQPVHNGACVVIDDAGVGMNAQEVQRAAALLSGQRTVDVSRLGDPPQFGFPVIGVLAARYGFSVSVDTRSPYGGVRAVLFLPSALLSQIDLDGPDTTPLAPPAARTGAPARTPTGAAHPPQHRAPAREHPEPIPDVFPPAAPPAGPPADAGAITGSTAGGLPKRRRRQPAAPLPAERPAAPSATVPDGPPAPGPAAAPPERTAEETARRMGAFARGTRSGRAAGTGPAGHPDPAPVDDEGNPYA
ncbi:ATP-binding protein [Streptomyces olivoreticuli]|uniref:ATP-binding protein n=1 Tax=Streptomyces olivoreticuli TaxID=68246 RepID=UPI00265ACBB8|nr:ATP-binding protein [Streptomyces olivoreticuli]WKK25404.1 ATP-binding protein [Streptomyces olivoreticuli]